MNNTRINVVVLQADLAWENITENLNYFENSIASLEQGTDLVVLPETFSTGFTMNARSNADRNGNTIRWMQELADAHNICLAGSIIIEESGCIYNRFLWVPPGGELRHYNKRHLFGIGGEDKQFCKGEERVIVNFRGFRFLLQVCYDLRFPAFSRNRGDYDAIIYIANWPSSRSHVWDILLPARAIENQAYVIGANRCGIDGEGQGTCGNSAIFDFKGIKKAWLEDTPGYMYCMLDLADLQEFKKKFPAYLDGDTFELKGIQ